MVDLTNLRIRVKIEQFEARADDNGYVREVNRETLLEAITCPTPVGLRVLLDQARNTLSRTYVDKDSQDATSSPM